MPTFTLTNLAKADLKEIGRYTQERWGREQRDLWWGHGGVRPDIRVFAQAALSFS